MLKPGNANTLLAPELRYGLISEKDYASTTSFLGSMKSWHYFTLWEWPSFASASINTHILRKKYGGFLAQACIFTGSFLFTTFGTHLVLSAKLLKLWEGLENPLGVAAAIRSMQSREQYHKGRQPTLPAPYDAPTPDFAPDFVQEESNPPPLQASPTKSPESDQPSSVADSSVPTSRWDEIRKASAGKSSNSTWDEIRQKHERPQAPGTNSERRDR
ncbi:hypothetical protein BT96DRAFT_912377 [Gymnopus androsaceus JB14]|uniref:Uncharacterized protein n=1 Tax=Gymnopus androsaceus JB14 TaxID=1447944 RepID=A0A6A4ITD8_9AGAR|nr:hypothetical protein BT96DRAFT_912377 [Gymnopus androsaceus JB14]